jgi:hypothetical protein
MSIVGGVDQGRSVFDENHPFLYAYTHAIYMYALLSHLIGVY